MAEDHGGCEYEGADSAVGPVVHLDNGISMAFHVDIEKHHGRGVVYTLNENLHHSHKYP